MLEEKTSETLKEMLSRLIVNGLTEEEKDRYTEAISICIRLLSVSMDTTKNLKFNKEWGE